MELRKLISQRLRHSLLKRNLAIGNIRYGGFISTAFQKRLIDHYGFDAVLDVGANRGQYAKELRNIVGFSGKIISFEPDPGLAKELRQDAESDPNWFVEEIALSDSDGSAKFNIMANDLFNSLSMPTDQDTEAYGDGNKVERVVEVDTAKLDSLFPRLKEKYGFKKPYLKLDTQGYDLVVLSGAKHSLKSIFALQSEVAVKRLYETSVTLEETLKEMSSHGYILCGFAPVSFRPFPEATEMDGFFVRTSG